LMVQQQFWRCQKPIQARMASGQIWSKIH